jgi:hypothetical protein
MILEALAGLALATNVALKTDDFDRPGLADGSTLTLRQKQAAMRPLVDEATRCIASSVSADPRFSAQIAKGDVNDLIVDSVATCFTTVRAMIDAHDRIFGQGSGEAFFMGPYLDTLPANVHELVQHRETHGQ